MISKFRVTFDSSERDYFIVHLPNGLLKLFKRTSRVLYASRILGQNTPTGGVALEIETVEERNASSPNAREMQNGRGDCRPHLCSQMTAI